MLVSFGLIVIGLLLVVGGAEAMIRGAVAIGRRLGISAAVIGLTFVAFGTSAPELVVSLMAASNGSSDIAVGNVVGSNIINILVVLGLAAAITPLRADRGIIRRDAPFMVAVTLIYVVLASTGDISWWNGLILIALLVGYTAYLIRDARQGGHADAAKITEDVEALLAKDMRLPMATVASLGGLAVLVFGADLFVGGALQVARTFGVPEAIIGVTLVAIGTSLPEIAASVVAALRGHADIAIGNVVGSNIFNILMVLGGSSVILTLDVAPQFTRLDNWIMLGVALGLWLLLRLRPTLGRPTGVAMLLGYAGYAAYLATHV